jgi:predicted ester cyclase
MGEARTLLEQNIKTWNDHDSSGWVGDFSPDADLAAPGVSGSGTDMVRMFYSIWQDAFPDNQVRVGAIFEDGATAILQADFVGTHTETLNTPDQSIPATGKRVSLPFVTLNKFAGGKVVNFALYFDRAELLGQLGLMPGST